MEHSKILIFIFLLFGLSFGVSAEPMAGIGNISFGQNPIPVGSNVDASIQIMANYTDVFQIRVLVNGSNRWNYTINLTSPGITTANLTLNTSELSEGEYNINFTLYNSTGTFADWAAESLEVQPTNDGLYFVNITLSPNQITVGDTIDVIVNLGDCLGPQYRMAFTINGTVYGNRTINCTGDCSILSTLNVSNLSAGSYMVTTSIYNMLDVYLNSLNETFQVNLAPAVISVRVTDPNGGEFLDGINYTIRFNASSGYSGPLAAYLFYDDNDAPPYWGAITNDFVNLSGYCTDPDNDTSTTNNCSILWQFEQWMSNMTLYVGVELKDLSNNSTAVDYSDGAFTVLYAGNYMPHALVVDPNGGENVTGLNYTIRFNVSDPDGDTLYANLLWDTNTNPNDGGWTIAAALNLSNRSICADPDNTTATANNCSFLWGIDPVLRGNWTYIGVWLSDSISYPTIDYSDAPFFANSTQNRAPALTVFSPANGTNITAGYLLATFNVSDPDGDRDLNGQIGIDNDTDSHGWFYTGRTWNHSLDCTDPDNDTRTPDNCTFRINLNRTLNHTNANLLLYVIDRVTDDNQYDLRYLANMTFTGVDDYEPVVEVTSPNGGETINTSQYTVTFNVSDADGNLMLGAAFYASDNTTFPGTGIGETMDLTDPRVCTDSDYNTSTTNNCSISWSIDSELNNRTLWLGAVATDGGDPAIDYSDGSVHLDITQWTFDKNLNTGWNLISIPLVIELEGHYG